MGSLRPYQERGLGWLATMAALGLGGCLADDMGLGKTMQMIAFLLARRDAAGGDTRPSLVVCPTSVVGNWEREMARFAPTLPVVRHYGSGRARRRRRSPPRRRTRSSSPATACCAATASCSARWTGARRSSTRRRTSRTPPPSRPRAARALRASHRFALTGTPVENRLAELWSILEFCDPGLLGPLAAFRRSFAVPIERYRRRATPPRGCARSSRPFVLRRLKSDPAVAADLPAKHEMTVVCTLTREQATLYKAAVDETLAKIEKTEGIERRGRVLALLTALKQICNHPAQYLRERGPLAGPVGQARAGDRDARGGARGGRPRARLHAVPRDGRPAGRAPARPRSGPRCCSCTAARRASARDEMVRALPGGRRTRPRVFVLSLKAGGTGLNLTRATHVFHFDRWWNPAVEDQATDRAHRIGQTRAVQVHQLLAAGTVEEKIDRMLEDKRALADRVVGAGETWITELPDAELRRLVTLSRDAAVAEEV